MRKIAYLPIILALLFVGAAVAQDVHTDYDHKANFERYHTYSWAKIETSNPLWQDRIKQAVDKELQAKGWQQVPSDGDVVLTAVGSTENKEEYQTFYNNLGPGWYWGGFGDTVATTSKVDYPVGTLVLDMYDASNKHLIWRGTATDSLSKNPDKNEHKLEKAVDKMFKNFPPKESRG